MKLRIWSDVHSEFGRLEVTTRDDDKDTVLVIAGDFFVWAQPDRDEILQQLTDLCQQFKAVIYVCGNHEFYGSLFTDVLDGMRMFADGQPNFHFLNNDMTIIDHVRFVGGTLWTDFNDGALYTMARCEQAMNDYRSILIKDDAGVRNMGTRFVKERNEQHRKMFMSMLSPTASLFDGKTVVVSHHLPSHKFVQNYAGGGLEYAYGNTRMDDILSMPIDLWIHGHVHVRQEYTLGDIPVVANPRGYYGHQTMAYTFDDAKTWDI